jgi:hypothetical protein
MSEAKSPTLVPVNGEMILPPDPGVCRDEDRCLVCEGNAKFGCASLQEMNLVRKHTYQPAGVPSLNLRTMRELVEAAVRSGAETIELPPAHVWAALERLQKTERVLQKVREIMVCDVPETC